MSRDRLVAILGGRFEERLSVVVAGAGFGKTVLLGQSVMQNRGAPRGEDWWLTCVPGDANVSSLAGAVLHPVGWPEPVPSDPDRAADAVAAAVWLRSPTDVALIIDDVHVVPAGSPGAEMLSLLPDRLPRNGHLVLAGRPPLPIASRAVLRVGLRLSEADLSFNGRELEEFAACRGVPMKLLQETAGWPALAELTSAAGSPGVIGYLWSEILSGLTRAERALLAAVAVAGGADAPLLSALADADVDAETLLSNRIPLTRRRTDGWYVLHPLWVPILRTELTSAELAFIQCRAAQALKRQGTADGLDAAVRLLVAAEEWPDLAEMIRETATTLYPLVGPDAAVDWLTMMPQHLRRGPDGLLLRGLAAKAEDLPFAASLFQQAAALFRDLGVAVGESAALLHLGHVCWWQMDLRRLVAVADRAGQIGPHGSAESAALIALSHVLVADLTNTPAEAMATLRSMPDAPRQVAVIVDYLRAVTLLELGEPAQAARYGRRCVERAWGPLRSSALSVAMSAAWFSGRIDDALGAVPRLVAAADLPDKAHNVVYERAVCAVMTGMVGDSQSAEGHLQIARSARAVTSADPSGETMVGLAEAVLLLSRADEGGASALLASQLQRRPLTDPGVARLHMFVLSLSYLLVPSSRPYWDDAALGPCFADARTLARILVGLRRGDEPAELAQLQLPSAAVVRALLPLPWATELAITLVELNRSEGATLLAGLGAAARPFLKLIAEHTPQLARAAKTALSLVPRAPRAGLRLRVLGPLEVVRDGHRLAHPDLRRDRVRWLLLYLIAHPTTVRADVAAALWPDMEPEAASRNLRVNLTYLQRVLEPDRTEEPYFVRSLGPGLRLIMDDWLQLDTQDFERIHRQAKNAEAAQNPARALQLYLSAVALYRGDYMADISDADWVSIDRERHRSAFIRAAVRAGELALASSAADESTRLARLALKADIYAEPAYRLLAAACLFSGDRTGAASALRQCRSRLRELGVVPEPATTMLFRRLER